MRFSVTLLVLPPEPCDTTSVAASASNQCPPTATPAPRDSTRFSSQRCLLGQRNLPPSNFFAHTQSPLPSYTSSFKRLRRALANRNTWPLSDPAQMIAHQTVQTIKFFRMSVAPAATLSASPVRTRTSPHALSNTVSRRSSVSASNPSPTSSMLTGDSTSRTPPTPAAHF